MNPEAIIAATLGPIVLLIVQSLKSFMPNMGKKAIPVTVVISAGFATLLVNWSESWQVSIIELATFTLAIAGVASGVYSWKGKDTNPVIDIPDYSDDV